MKIPAGILVCSFCCFMFGVTALRAAPFLEISTSCEGRQTNGTNRFKIIGWNGRNKQALSQRVYDFRVDCNGSSKHIMELFLASVSSDRYKKEGFTLFKQEGTRRKSVKVRERGCKLVPERQRTYPSDSEARAACRGSPTPMACELEYQGQDRWVTVQVERCWRARYESRDVPVWKPFPSGYAPLPPGARIVEGSEQRPPVAPAPQPQATTTPQSPTSASNGGPGLGTLLLIIAAGAVLFLFVRRHRPAVSTEQHSPGDGNRQWDESEYFEDQTQGSQSDETETEMPSDELPQSRAEAYALLNIDEDTEPEVANRVYRAMAQVWHEDLATDESDRARREKKMKQLNAAKEYIMGKRT